MRPSLLALRLAVLLSLSLCPLRAEGKFEVLGPVETLDNGVVTLQVTPKTGRIVSYHRKGEGNWLAISDTPPKPNWHWNPWGGDRLIPAPQFLSPQIYGTTGADDIIDGEPWTVVSKSPIRIEMQSGVSPQLGLRVTRRIELLPGSTEAVHTFRFERVRESPFPVHAWTITTVRAGDYVVMESLPMLHPGWKAFRTWPDLSPVAVTAGVALLGKSRFLKVPWPGELLKLGTFGHWIALASGPSAFRQAIDYDAALPYLDATNLQTFLDPKAPTYELETQSPSWFLRTGEAREWKVRWTLLDFPADAKDEAAKAAFLNATADGFVPSK
ncbi:hypothetical protein SAMN05444156_1697 [Verrucomicrobium sp. GAS474]|uniref:hypothetical protein n=1 Tax=Verrucomicrobium sp. GAS474 TaxID=1882831 RepID=UPI0008796CA5|nr:hypothetical protein [Verrucomicrobium sp. GAS474]SDU05504.1 hypothetical protein SAMN05444156_1697 [Verrucomicrobium sp. GAS474]